MDAIPIVDFSAFPHGSDEEKRRAALAIDDAFQHTGFVYLKNHGVSADKVDECFEWSRKFFALPPSTKLLAPHPPGGTHHRGYSSPGLEQVTQPTSSASPELPTTQHSTAPAPDYKESFDTGNPLDASQPNIWPPDSVLPGFRAFIESHFTSCKTLIHHLLDALSLALHVSPPGLSHTHASSLFQLRLLHYPPLAATDLRNGRRGRIGAHSDFGTLTLLFQDSVGGLQVERPGQAGVFVDVAPVEGAVLVNIGDLMARWSNGRWKSTVHRVGLPAGGAEGDGERTVPERFSVPFFATADMETVIEALPGCWGEGKPKIYEPVTAWEYVQMRMKALYD